MESSLIATITQMNLVIVIAVTALAVLLGLAFYRIAAYRRSSLAGSDYKSQIEPLDVLAFNNLIDPAEEDFLRENLSSPAFRYIQRLRLRAAMEYVTCASKNAALLIRLGKAVNSAADPHRSLEARDLVTSAVQLRLLAVLVLCLLRIKIAFPGLRLSLKEVSALHDRLIRQHTFLDRVRGSDRLLKSSS